MGIYSPVHSAFHFDWEENKLISDLLLCIHLICILFKLATIASIEQQRVAAASSIADSIGQKIDITFAHIMSIKTDV